MGERDGADVSQVSRTGGAKTGFPTPSNVDLY